MQSVLPFGKVSYVPGSTGREMRQVKPKKQKQAEALARLELLQSREQIRITDCPPHLREARELKIGQRQGHINYLREKFGVSP